jgi:sec-independent protein translocase protein TatA
MVGDIMQPTHLLFVLVVALLVLGPKRLPEVGRTLGSGIRDFRQALSGEISDDHRDRDRVDSATTEQRHQPAVAPEADASVPSWHDEAVGPIHVDQSDVGEPAVQEPVAVEPASPATEPAPQPEPVVQASEPEHAVAQSASDTRTEPSA